MSAGEDGQVNQRMGFFGKIPSKGKTTAIDVPPSARSADKQPHYLQKLRSMHGTGILKLKNMSLREEDISFICKEISFKNIELKKLSMKNCELVGQMLGKLIENTKITKVQSLNLSKNPGVDLLTVQQAFTKWRCQSITLSHMVFYEDEIEHLAYINVKKLTMNYATFPSNIAAALSRCLKNGVEILSMINSNMNCSRFVETVNGLNDIKMIPLTELDVSYTVLDKESLIAIGSLINKSMGSFQKLALFGCNIDRESLDAFRLTVQGEVRELDIGWNESLSLGGMQSIIDLLAKVKVQKLDLSFCRLKSRDILQLRMSSNKLMSLDLSENPGIDAAEVGSLASKWELETLNISDCGAFTEIYFEILANSLKNHKLKVLYCNEVSRKSDESWIEEIKRIMKDAAEQVFAM